MIWANSDDDARPAPAITFKVRLSHGLGWSEAWDVTKTTRAYVYFYRSEYDGAEKYARRMRWREWWRRIVDDEIRMDFGEGDAAVKNRRVRELARDTLVQLGSCGG